MLQVLGNMLVGLTEWRLGKLFARLLWLGTGAMTEHHLDDPVYKKNMERLIERNRQFEEERNGRHS
jgi:hypothetical protein